LRIENKTPEKESGETPEDPGINSGELWGLIKEVNKYG